MLTSEAQGSQASFGAGVRLSYPKDKINNDTDYVKFDVYKYKPPFTTGSDSGDSLSSYNSSTNNLGSKLASVLLYMPEDIQAEYGAQWSGRNISNVGRGVLGAVGALGPGNNPAEKGQEALNKVLKTGKEVTENFITQGTAIANLVKGALSGAQFDDLSVNNILSLTSGRVLNPNTELIYDGPQMRNFNLSFKMAPKNGPEATEIKNIITVFKQAILPKFNGDTSQSGGSQSLRAFVGVPNIVDVSFMTGSSLNPYVSQFKPSVLTNVNVSYTPDGAWATYTDGSPVATTISLSFMELKMVYAEDIYGQGASY